MIVMKLLNQTIENNEEVSIDSDGNIRNRLNKLAIPSGSLGRLEEFATIYASIKGSTDVSIKHKVVFTAANAETSLLSPALTQLGFTL